MVQTGSRYVLAYLLWAISTVLAIAALLAWRSSAMIILGVTPWDRYLEHTLNQFGFLFLAIIGLIVIVFAEHYFRTAVEQGRLAMRFFFIAAIELFVLVAAHLARLVGSIMLDIPLTDIWVVLGVEAILYVAAVLFYRRAKQNYVAPTIN